MQGKAQVITPPNTRRAWGGLVIVLLMALLVRVGDGGATTHFRYDQAQLSLLALDMTHGKSLPLLGIQSSAGVPNSPMTVYLLAIPFLFTSNPLVVTLVIAVWNVVGVGLLWGLTYRYFGPMVAFVAGMTYAVSPYAVYYSRSIWAQDYHTPLILVALWLGLYGFVEGKRWARVLCLPLFIIAFQIHFAAWTLLPVYLWFLWAGRRNLKVLDLGLSVVLSGLTLLPFAIGIAQESSGAAARADRIISILQDGLKLRWYPLEQVMNLATGLGIEDTASSNPRAVLAQVPHWNLLWQLIGVLVLVGCVLVWLPRWREYVGLVWLWAGITLAAFIPMWTGSGVYPHYFIPTIPALALLTGLGLVGTAHLLERLPGRPLSKGLLYGIVGIALLSQAWWMLNLYRFNLTTYTFTRSSGQTKTPLTYLMKVRAVLQDYDDVIILGANPHESNYYVWQPLLYDSAMCVRDLLINGGVIDILPQGAFAVVVAPRHPINANYEVPPRYQHENPIEIALRPGEDSYVIYPFVQAPEWTETPITPVEVPAFENGIRLSGYYLTAEWLQLRWQVLKAPGETYQYFGHFLDAAGERIGQRDAPFYVGQHWCTGDTLITSVPIELPPGVATLRVGMYQLMEDGSTIEQRVLDDAGQASATWIDIPLADFEESAPDS